MIFGRWPEKVLWATERPYGKLLKRFDCTTLMQDLKEGDKGMRIGLLVVAGVALIGFLAVAVVLPQMEGGEVRDAAAVLVSGANPAKNEVAAAAEKAGNLAGAGANVKLPPKIDPKYGELKWIVEPGGVIRGWNEKNAIEVAITPVLAAGKVAWTCKGYPAQSMPVTCGGK